MKTIAILLSTLLLTQTSCNSAQAQPNNLTTSGHHIAQADDGFSRSPQEVQQTAKNITVLVTSANNGGSGVIIAQKGNTYLVLTNAHVTRRATQFQIQAPDGRKYTAKSIDGGFDSKSDLALLQFTSRTKYTLADLSDVVSPLEPERTIYSSGFPFDSRDIRITSGKVSQPQEQAEGERWLTYADRLHRTLQFSKSIIAYDKAIAKGEVFNGNYGKALSLSLAGKTQLAEAAIGKAIAIIPNPQPNSDPRQYNYVWKQQNAILQRLGKYTEALKAIDTALKLDPNNPSLLNEKAAIFSLNKQYSAAIAIYDKSIETQPEAYIYVNRGITKLASGDPGGAILDHSKAIELNPNYANAYSCRGNAKSILGDNLGAISDHDRAIKIDPNNSVNYYNRGIAKYKAGDKQGAIGDFDRAISIDPEYAAAYYNRGTNKAALKDFSGAIADYDVALKLNPTLAQAYTNRGMARSALGLKQEAIEDYNKSILIDPNNPIAYYNRADIKSNLGNKQGAIEDYDRAIALNPKDTDYYYNRGKIKHKLGDKQGAISDYSAALKLNPKLAEIFQSRGLAKLELRDKKGAIADLSEAIKIDPSSAEYYFGRGLARADVGDKKGAIEDYSEVIKLNPKFAADLYFYRGEAKSELGDKQGAILDVTSAAELFRQQGRVNDYQKAIELIAKLKGN